MADKVPDWRPKLIGAVSAALRRHKPPQCTPADALHAQMAVMCAAASVHIGRAGAPLSVDLMQHMVHQGIEAMERARLDWERQRN